MKNHLVVALAYDRLCTFEFGCVVELFALQRPELGVPWYRFAVCSAERKPLRAAGGIKVSVPFSLKILLAGAPRQHESAHFVTPIQGSDRSRARRMDSA